MGIAASIFGKDYYEEPKYEVLAKRAYYEIRHYHEMVLASVEMDDSSEAFKTLARYIGVFSTPENTAANPHNEHSERVSQANPEVSMPDPPAMAMTVPVISADSREHINMAAPVLSDQSKSHLNCMSFVLPSKYTLATAPTPLDVRVKLYTVPASIWAVHQFNGRFDSKDASKYLELKQWIEEEFAMVETGDGNVRYQNAVYNSPLTIPHFRRNEVMIEVTRTGKYKDKINAK